jgi:hypothetical protein
MFLKKSLAALALGFSGLASAGTLTSQGVTFNTWAVDSDTMGLQILNVLNATGNWAPAQFLKSFEVKNVAFGSGAEVASASIASGPGSFASTVSAGLSANGGCATGGTPGACFVSSPAVTLTNNMTWTIDFTASSGGTLNFDNAHLKVQFLTNATDTKATGDLLSQNIVTAVPEPETYAMMLAGLGLMGAIVRRRKNKVA